MIFKNKTFLILLSIFIIAFALRFYKSNYPPFLWDEAALGYNAYSILQTGRDEYGKLLPLIFKSFGDFKPGIYIYLTLPFIKIFGLNEMAVRLPSILIGSLTPILLYFLIKELDSKNNKLAIISALILTFNPYNIHFSHAAWETNILTAELILASFLFIKAFKNNSKISFFFSSFVFGLSLYTYQAAKMISLFLIIILFLINFSKIKTHLKSIFWFIIPLAIFTIPVIYGLLFSQNGNRLNVVSLLSYPRSQEETKTIISESNIIDYNVFYNRAFFFSRNFLSRYFNNFSSKFLIFEGDWQNPRHSAPYIGVILYPSIIFLLIGFFSIFINKKIQTIDLFFLLWFLLAPISSALTRDLIQPIRSMSFSIPLVYFISLGIFIFLDKFKNILVYSLLILCYLLSFIYYSDLYYNHMIKKSPNDFLYGYKEAMTYLVKNKDKFNRMEFTDFYGQPYIYYLFYSQYPPTKYQNQAKLTENKSGDTGTVEKIDNISFKSINYNGIKNESKVLSIFSYDEILRQGINNLPEFSNFIPLSPIGGHSTFYAYETK
jgi:4-amino-4-deoxy-L-arabinose transferase-like glycosyltransferase